MQWSKSLALTALCCIQSSIAAIVTLPPSNGSFGVACTVQEVVNNNLSDPFDPDGQSRRIMLSVFFPTFTRTDRQEVEVPYMPPLTASVYDQLYAEESIPNGTFEAFQLTLCKENDSMSVFEPHLHLPVILFSPGLGNSRLICSAIAESLAAQGFVVITVDHPHDAAIVQFPDGSYVPAANITSSDQIEMALDIRTQDVTFVVDQLHNTTSTESLLTGLYGSINLKTIFIAGHSLGSATAASAMLNDVRFLSGIDLDGTPFGTVIQDGLTRPFMMLAHEGKN